MLDIRKLTYLEAVHRYKSFTRASEALYVSQPTISEAVFSLEKKFGVKLITRTSKKIFFTPEGEQLIQQIRHILKLCDETEAMLNDFSVSANQQLRIGISWAISTFLIPHIYSRFLLDHPNANLQFSEGDMYANINELRNDTLDLAYNALPTAAEADDMELIAISSSHLHAAIPSDHPYAKLTTISLDLLAAEKLVIMGATSRSAVVLMDAFDRLELSPEIAFSCNHYSCFYEVLNIQGYIGILNVMDGQPLPRRRGITLRPITNVDSIPIGFLRKKGKYVSRLERDFVSFVSEIYPSR